MIVLAVLLNLGLAGHGFSQAPFYEGKTINVVYGGGPGGTVDLRFRATAAVLQKHIPGKPTMAIEYMPGGGSRKAGNHLYRARPDGLTMGVMLSSFVPALRRGLLAAATIGFAQFPRARIGFNPACAVNLNPARLVCFSSIKPAETIASLGDRAATSF
jgi:tripartite-type tricarboxylate transporter receptor subunit TctC